MGQNGFMVNVFIWSYSQKSFVKLENCCTESGHRAVVCDQPAFRGIEQLADKEDLEQVRPLLRANAVIVVKNASMLVECRMRQSQAALQLFALVLAMMEKSSKM